MNTKKNVCKKITLFFHVMYAVITSLSSFIHTDNSPDFITIAILAKDKAHTLPYLLKCIECQTWPASQTYLYIRTNNNNDNTVEILKNWIKKVGHRYGKIYFDDCDVPQKIQQYKQHEWNSTRFKVLGKIRSDSVAWAYENNSHYFVVDCDNFIKPHTIEALWSTNLPIVAPLLGSNCCYSNYHAAVDDRGYFKNCPEYLQYLNREICGLIQVPVVHCTYFIRKEFLPFMSYDDESYRYEYVIFSDSARKQCIPQYLDNREAYGYITFAEDAQGVADDHGIAQCMQEVEK